jgi:hypothetical protein
VRVRILKQLVGVIDRVSLAALKPGFSYVLERTLGLYLIHLGGAEESRASPQALIPPMDDPYIAHLTGGITIIQTDNGPLISGKPPSVSS